MGHRSGRQQGGALAAARGPVSGRVGAAPGSTPHFLLTALLMAAWLGACASSTDRSAAVSRPREHAAAPPGSIAFMQAGRVWLVPADGAEPRPLTETLRFAADRPLAWMPDGRSILYWSHGEAGWDIWSVDVESGRTRNLTETPRGGSRSAAPSPDGRTIACMRDDPEGVWLMDADGSNRRRLTERGFRDDPPSWSPDGSSIAYGVLDDRGSRVEVIRLDGTGAPRVLPGGAPRFSPADGRLLLVGVEEGAPALVLVDPALGSRKILVTAGGTIGHPVWSPDGSRIAYFVTMAGSDELRVRSLIDGSDRRLAVAAPRADGPVAWSPDGRWIAVPAGPDGASTLRLIHLESGATRALAGPGAVFPAWRPS